MEASRDVAFQFKRLGLAPSPENYALYRSALEYDLIEPIVIETRQDLRSERKWRNLVEPYQHQVSNLITFCRRLPVTMLADDVGLGKTISAGLIASELIARHKISRILIVCPKLLMPQWREELDYKFGIKAHEASGRKLLSTRPPEPAGAVITTYQSARLYLDSIAKVGFDMLILDEAHKLRNLFGVDKPPAVARKFRQALADRLFKYVVMLTATPIQNRLWDLYSLIDLLTVARGHENPFGSTSSFENRFIADKPDQARKLRPERRDEFRSIVYGYMSRVRRADAKLYFPTRKVQMSRVPPTPEEQEMFRLIAEPIQKMNRLTQISIAQALVSSPQALVSELENMAAHGTVPPNIAADARNILSCIKTTAKLDGLSKLFQGLRKERPNDWRAVVFTSRRQTQGAISEYLESQKIPYGVINGSTGARNQETLKQFRANPPEINVIVSTEAGSEGVNLQVANVVVNYDLPWNPMVVEQRIGRVQRLASNHANVIVFNVVLAKTFEEYIVGRLMEKLQMASHAIGDVESLLEAAGMDDDEKGFEEKLRGLVISSLTGKDTEKATKLAEQSISSAKVTLEQEEQNINSILGGAGDVANTGPPAPKLPPQPRSMEPREFVLSALSSLGAQVTIDDNGRYVSTLNGTKEIIHFEENGSAGAGISYALGSPAFERLVSQIAANGLHLLGDADIDLTTDLPTIVDLWVHSFQGEKQNFAVEEAARSFSGSALLRVRATVAHDSYERLVDVLCSPNENRVTSGDAMSPLGRTVSDLASAGLSQESFLQKAISDSHLQEFCRFYRDRLAQEITMVGQDERKKRKLQDDFTPRITMTLVGLKGAVQREMRIKVVYSIGPEATYESRITIQPSSKSIIVEPPRNTCSITNTQVPEDCLATCAISGKKALRHLLIKSEISGRQALPEYAVTCGLTGKRILSDEIAVSDLSGKSIAKELLKVSPISGKRGEPDYFGVCDFTGVEVLKDELAESQVSRRRFRSDQKLESVVTGKIGHESEFVMCGETGRPLLSEEGQKCEVSRKVVLPGILQTCEVTGKHVLPRELGMCGVTSKRVLRSLLVASSLSGNLCLQDKAIRSSNGAYCLPSETVKCSWSDRVIHPSDIRTCSLTGVRVHFDYISKADNCLSALVPLLDGTGKKSDSDRLWGDIANSASKFLGNARCSVESAELSPEGTHVALCLDVRTWLGLKSRQAAGVYSISERTMVGRVAIGKREGGRWRSEKS